MSISDFIPHGRATACVQHAAALGRSDLLADPRHDLRASGGGDLRLRRICCVYRWRAGCRHADRSSLVYLEKLYDPLNKLSGSGRAWPARGAGASRLRRARPRSGHQGCARRDRICRDRPRTLRFDHVSFEYRAWGASAAGHRRHDLARRRWSRSSDQAVSARPHC